MQAIAPSRSRTFIMAKPVAVMTAWMFRRGRRNEHARRVRSPDPAVIDRRYSGVMRFLICMARAIWKGNISFGLVNIPIALYAATRREELKFRLLRKADLSLVNYKRVAEKDGREVPWD